MEIRGSSVHLSAINNRPLMIYTRWVNQAVLPFGLQGTPPRSSTDATSEICRGTIRSAASINPDTRCLHREYNRTYELETFGLNHEPLQQEARRYSFLSIVLSGWIIKNNVPMGRWFYLKHMVGRSEYRTMLFSNGVRRFGRKGQTVRFLSRIYKSEQWRAMLLNKRPRRSADGNA